MVVQNNTVQMYFLSNLNTLVSTKIHWYYYIIGRNRRKPLEEVTDEVSDKVTDHSRKARELGPNATPRHATPRRTRFVCLDKRFMHPLPTPRHAMRGL